MDLEKNVEVFVRKILLRCDRMIKKHPGGNIIELCAENGEDATPHFLLSNFTIVPFKVLARMKGLQRRPAANEGRNDVILLSHFLTNNISGALQYKDVFFVHLREHLLENETVN